MIHRRATALMFFVFVEWRRIEVQGSYRYLWEKIYLSQSVRYQSMSSVESWNSLAYQGCQLSRIIQETPDFEPFLPVSRLESEISR